MSRNNRTCGECKFAGVSTTASSLAPALSPQAYKRLVAARAAGTADYSCGYFGPVLAERAQKCSKYVSDRA
jgi:hypothetical protein